MNENQAIKLLEETFSNDFDMDQFLRFTKELFNHFNEKTGKGILNIGREYLDYVESMKSLGTYRDKRNNDMIEVFSVKLKRASSMSRARTMQRNLIAKYLSKSNRKAALVAFYGENHDWRLSFVKMEYQVFKDKDGNLKVEEDLTPAKRYSFLVGPNEPNYTCKYQFLDLIKQEDVDPSLEEIESIFSIEKVTQEFFSKYKDLFLSLKESVEEIIKTDEVVKVEFDEKMIEPGDFAKKLLGQIVFIYFLQKKGWLGVEKGEKWGTGPKNFLRKLFKGEVFEGKKIEYENFFNEILEPLFYEALSSERDDNYYRLFDCKIPFLNGGLFEPINGYDWVKTDLTIGNSVFEEIFDTFDTFNFTVKEDEPLEKEVAVDPEMLGKVFENLLEVKDRKSKGAFYTPREIVHYMCQQSLINYLENNSEVPNEDIETFIQLGDFALDSIIKEQEDQKRYSGHSYGKTLLPDSIKYNYEELDDLLKDIKVVDPAVGSGAFPVGMMNEIMRARSILTVFSGTEKTSYDLKREIIEKCLYGVDIDASAVDITKLRFWLSLIVDETDIHNIKPLPNLDHKIMCGNSLLDEFEGIKLFDEKLLGTPKGPSPKIEAIDTNIKSLEEELKIIRNDNTQITRSEEIDDELKKLRRKKKRLIASKDEDDTQLGLYEEESEKRLKKLKKLQKEFFNERGSQRKKELRSKIETMEWELIEETLKESGNEASMKKVEQYKKNNSKPFFLWKLYFAEVFQKNNPGFDVVIANPPYVQIKQISNDDKNKFRKKYKCATGRFNLFYLFLELSHLISKKSGIAAYIIPDRLLLNTQCQNLRSWLLNQQELLEIDSFSDPIFNAIVDSIIIFYKNNNINSDVIKSKNNILIEDLRKKEFKEIPISFFKDSANSQFDLNYDPNIYNLILKIKEQSKLLGEIGDTKDGIIQSKIPDILFLKNPLDNDSKKLLFGKDVNKYSIRFNDNWVNYKPRDMKKIESERGGNGLRLRKKEVFEREKILTRQTADKIIGCLDEDNYYYSNTLHGTAIIDPTFNNKYVLGILNSNLMTFYYRSTTSESGKVFAQIKIKILKQLPIKILPIEKQMPLVNLVNQLLVIKKDLKYLKSPENLEKIKKLEKKINLFVYEIYNLTPSEIKIVENFVKD